MGEKSYKQFIDYLYNNHTIKALHIMLPKTSIYAKSCNELTKWVYFLIEDDNSLKNIILFRIKLVVISKKNLIACL